MANRLRDGWCFWLIEQLERENGGSSADAGPLRYPTCSLHTTRVFGLGSGHPGLLGITLAQVATCAKWQVRSICLKFQIL